MVIATDYTAGILTKARRERKKYPQESILHYALYIEHKINAIIRLLSDRKNLEPSVSLGLMRELKLSSKATWALHLLDGEMFDDMVVKKIGQISDRRNEYAHYKWKGTDPDDRREEDRSIKLLVETLADAEIVVSAISKYENKTFFNGEFRKVKSILKSKKLSNTIIDEVT